LLGRAITAYRAYKDAGAACRRLTRQRTGTAGRRVISVLSATSRDSEVTANRANRVAMAMVASAIAKWPPIQPRRPPANGKYAYRGPRDRGEQGGEGVVCLANRKMAADTAAKAAGEREVCVSRPCRLGGGLEAARVESLRIRPEVGVPVGGPRAEQHDGAGWDAVSHDRHLGLGKPAERERWW